MFAVVCFLLLVQRPKPLFLCIFLPLTSLSLLLFLDDDGAVEGDWEERWRQWWWLCRPQPVVLPLLSFVSLLVSAFFLFFHSPYILKIPRFVPLFHTKNPPPVLIFLSAQKSPSESIVCMSPSPKFCHPYVL